MPGAKYSKGIAKTEEILEAALRTVAEKGYSRATIRELAETVGLSKTGLLHHFGSKEALFIEILRRRADLGQARVVQATSNSEDFQLSDIARLGMAEPGLIQLYARFSAEATEPGHPAHEFFQQRYVDSRARTAQVIAQYQSRGLLAKTLNPETVASAFLAMYDGLQIQWLLDANIDIAGVLADFLEWIGLGRHDGKSPSRA